MFVATEIERAVDLQRRSYTLLRWATDAVDKGFIRFETLHQFGTLPAAATGWIDEHYDNLPKPARPARADLRDFVNLFTTYLEGSFDLIEHPGQRRDSRDNHCYCPMCSWLVDMPQLQPKQIARADKERAKRLQLDAIGLRAAQLERVLPAGRAEELVADPALRDTLGLVAYGDDLLRRLGGTSYGAVSLTLWRRFAWTAQGSPKQNFELRASAILEAEQALVARLTR